MIQKIPVLVVAGPTASGKTGLAVRLCQTLHGEVVSADSMQVYREMRIGTARPTEAEMGDVPHHLLGFQPLDEPFSVSDYVRLASRTIADIYARGRLPVLVGGTGLYIRSLLQGLSFQGQGADPALRARLAALAQQEGVEALHARLAAIDPEAAAAIHPHNVKRVVRAIEIFETTGKTPTQAARDACREAPPYDPCFLCLGFQDRAALYERIDQRVDQMLADGLEQEARAVFAATRSETARQAIGYKELLPYLRGEVTLDQAADAIKRATRHYAKRQLTWFRREKDAQWLLVDTFATPDALLEEALRRVRMKKWSGSFLCT